MLSALVTRVIAAAALVFLFSAVSYPLVFFGAIVILRETFMWYGLWQQQSSRSRQPSLAWLR